MFEAVTNKLLGNMNLCENFQKFKINFFLFLFFILNIPSTCISFFFLVLNS